MEPISDEIPDHRVGMIIERRRDFKVIHRRLTQLFLLAPIYILKFHEMFLEHLTST